MHPEFRVRLSKFLSLILRHRPEEVGVALDGAGRVAIAELVEALRRNGWEDITAEEIREVARQDARRFELAGDTIRARYGHTLTLERPGNPARPPEWLYLAVPEEELPAARQEGLRPGSRQYVHLCLTPQEAARLLDRRQVAGQIVTVLARRAHGQGLSFFQATESLFLVERVPREFVLLPAVPEPARAG